MKTTYSWQQKKYPPPNRKLLKSLLSEIIELSGLDEVSGGQSICFSFVDIATISRINSDFVGHQGVTDVISFDYRSTDSYGDTAADIIICVEKAAEEARRRKTSSFADELVLYAVHGALHIAGEDDLEEAKRKNMRKEEKRIIGKLKKKFRFDNIFGDGKTCL